MVCVCGGVCECVCVCVYTQRLDHTQKSRAGFRVLDCVESCLARLCSLMFSVFPLTHGFFITLLLTHASYRCSANHSQQITLFTTCRSPRQTETLALL